MKRIPFRTVEQARAGAPAVIAHLQRGGLIAYPTETIYGFGGLTTWGPLEDLMRLKGREGNRPFLLLAADPASLPGLTWSSAAVALRDAFWPGPLTIALNADPNIYAPQLLSPPNTVAIRRTSLAPLAALLDELHNAPLTSTSANLAGGVPATTANQAESVLAAAHEHDVLVLDGGDLPAALPSTIVDCANDTPRVIRAGAITIDALNAVLSPEGISIDVR